MEFNHRTTWFEQEIADWAFQGSTFTLPPSAISIGLHTGDPTQSGADNEVDNADYNRAEISISDMTVTSQNPTVITNDIPVVFEQSQSNWGTVTHGSIWAGSNPLYWAEFTDENIINSGEIYEIRAGDIIIEEH